VTYRELLDEKARVSAWRDRLNASRDLAGEARNRLKDGYARIRSERSRLDTEEKQLNSDRDRLYTGWGMTCAAEEANRAAWASVTAAIDAYDVGHIAEVPRD